MLTLTSTFASPSGTTVFPPWPSSVAISAQRLWPGGVGPETLLSQAELRFTSDVTAGTALDDEGRPVTFAGGSPSAVIVAGAPVAGQYRGQIDVTGSGESLDLTIRVRDVVIWALGTLLAGYLLGARLESWFSRDAPRGVLRVRLVELADESRRFSNEEGRVLQDRAAFVGDDRSPIELISADRKGGLLHTLAEESVADFDASVSPGVRDARWGKHGTELQKVRDVVFAQQGNQWLRSDSDDRYASLVTRLGPRLGPQLASSELRRKLGRAGGGGLFETKPAWAAKQAELGAVQAFLEAADSMLGALEAMERREGLTAHERSAVDALRARLANPIEGSIAEVDVIRADARSLYRAIIERQEERVVDAPGADNGEDEVLMYLEPGADTGGGADEGLFEQTTDVLLRRLGLLNTVYLVVGGLVVGLVALSALYFPNPAFGRPADYLSLLVWASGGSFIAQLAKWQAFARMVGRLRAASAGAVAEPEAYG